MKLEDQVVSLPLAKQLKELGAEQESLFYWKVDTDDDLPSYGVQFVSRKELEAGDGSIRTIASAYTVAELGEMLPETIQEHYLNISKYEGSWYCSYCKTEEDVLRIGKERVDFSAHTEADAIAKMLCYLKAKINLI